MPFLLGITCFVVLWHFLPWWAYFIVFFLWMALDDA